MSIGFIGAGKVGTAMGLFLKTKAYTVSGYVSQKFSESQAAATLTHSESFSSLIDLLQNSEFIGITTPDDVIEDIVLKLAALNVSLTNKFIFHMSGSLSASVLKPLEEKGATIFSLHPLQAVADPISGAKNFETCYFALESEPCDLTRFLNVLERPIIHLRTGEKARYHLAAVLASNYTVTLIDLAIQQLCVAGFAEEEARKALMPLIHGTLQNIDQFGTQSALTGPIVRADAQTVQRHLKKISHNSNLLKVYKTLGSETLRLARQTHKKSPEQYDALEHLFQEGEQEE